MPALHFVHYNFCRIHQTLPLTSAKEAGELFQTVLVPTNCVSTGTADLLPKGAGNFEGQTQVGAKSALFNEVDGLARHTHLGGQLGL
jgi:hypothetical protein